MGKFVKGEVFVVPFSFSDLSANKKRPSMVVAALSGDDGILFEITNKTMSDSYTVPITNTDFKTGTLHQDSNIRPNRLFTADSNIILYRAGVLTPSKIKEVAAKIVEIVSA